jgi:hypothetical protein
MTNHSITPPPELVQQWFDEASELETPTRCHIATRAAQWGADMELEACVDWLKKKGWEYCPDPLRAARRPKPPSLKEQALCELVDAYNLGQIDDSTYDIIRKALKALPND